VNIDAANTIPPTAQPETSCCGPRSYSVLAMWCSPFGDHRPTATGEPASPIAGDPASPGCARAFPAMEDYEIRIRGRVSPAVLARFEGMRSEVEPVET